MNISTGGPHILFFERDQQLTALLTSEFQLAGYECHAARTAVEVFDTIARYPIRILLVNLAQAAAGRREFWVALDTQRRGRGVQVFTFHCSNLASYGPRDADERVHMMKADLEIDGMLGLMSLVDAVRQRVPGSSVTAATNPIPRMTRATPPPAPSTTQPTTAPVGAGSTSFRPAPATDVLPNQATEANVSLSSASPTAIPPTPRNGATVGNQQSYSEKIRAVLYPNQRPMSTQSNTSSLQNVQAPTERSSRSHDYTAQNMPNTQDIQSEAQEATILQRLANGQTEEEPQESGLAQLSRMVEEFRAPDGEEERNNTSYQAGADATNGQANLVGINQSYTVAPEVGYSSYSSTPAQQSQVTGPIGAQPLRASPIEDLPWEHASSGQPTTDETRRGIDGSARAGGYGQYGYTDQSAATQTSTTSSLPLASISTLTSPSGQTTQTTPTPPEARATSATSTVPTAPTTQPSSVVRATIPVPAVPSAQPGTAPTWTEPVAAASHSPQAPVPPTVREPIEEYDENDENGEEDEGEPTSNLPAIGHVGGNAERNQEEQKNDSGAVERIQQAQAAMQDAVEQREDSKADVFSQSATLFDIVQSLPTMPSPSRPSQPTSPRSVSGRTMRSLGSVLLEGHLVQQSRLEVAQNIQRMLRGVDLNYQLGEILLMFKLLTPDQLLAASLVSYGMISTQQISALGRIRQELHAIGLEYDLESLLILFRMLTPEQLREVRASWQG